MTQQCVKAFCKSKQKIENLLIQISKSPANFTVASANSSVRCIENPKLAGGDALDGGGGLDEEAAIGLSSDKARAQAFGVADFEKESS